MRTRRADRSGAARTRAGNRPQMQGTRPLRLQFPEEVGGAASTNLTFTLVERELGAAGPWASLSFSGAVRILMACNEESARAIPAPSRPRRQVRRARHDRTGCRLGRARHEMLRRQDGDDWIVNGTKHFISHAAFRFRHRLRRHRRGADAARTEEEDHLFLVDRGTPASKSAKATFPSRIAATRTASSLSTTAGCFRQILGEPIKASILPTTGSTPRA